MDDEEAVPNIDPFTGNEMLSELSPRARDLSDRFGLNLTHAFRTENSLGIASMLPAQDGFFRPPNATGELDAEGQAFYTARQAQQDRLDAETKEQIRDRLLAYKLMPGYQGAAEGAAALAGRLAGTALSPEALIMPEVKLGTVAFRAAHPVMQRIFGLGAGGAAVQGAADPIVQSLAIEAAVQEHRDWTRSALAAPIGFMMGAGA